MDVDRHAQPGGGSSTMPSLDLSPSKVSVLHGHQSEVFTCAWNPQGDVIVSGSVSGCDGGGRERVCVSKVLLPLPIGQVTQLHVCGISMTMAHVTLL